MAGVEVTVERVVTKFLELEIGFRTIGETTENLRTVFTNCSSMILVEGRGLVVVGGTRASELVSGIQVVAGNLNVPNSHELF